MKKKVIALLLAAAMAISLTACGDTSKTESTAEETAKQEETTKESENTEKAEEASDAVDVQAEERTAGEVQIGGIWIR